MADGHLNFDTKIDEKGFNTGIGKLNSLAKSGVAAAGKALAGITAAVGTGIGAAVKVGASFEAEMSKVSAISGAAGTELDLLADKAKEMGSKTKFSATESAQAFEYMAMAGWKTEDMLSGIEGIMDLAAASGQDLASTSDIVTDALTAFGMTASDSGHFADVLAAASSNANTNVGLMGETFKYVAPVAGALGYSAEDMAVAIGLMANSGIKATQAGTSLRSILSRMTNPTSEVKTAMDALGLSVVDSAGEMKPFGDILGNLREAFSGLSESEKAQMAASIAGQEAMSGLLAIANASDSDFNKLKDSIYNCNGAAADMASTMQDNLIGQLTLLKSSAEGLGIEIYESLQKPLTDFVKSAVGLVSELTAAYQSGGFDGFLKELGNQIPAIQGVTGAISDLAAKLQGMSSEELKSFAKTALTIGAAVPGFKIFAGGVGTAKTAVSGFDGIIDGTASKVSKLPEKIKGAGKSLSSLGKNFSNLGHAIALPFTDLGAKIVPSIKNVAASMGEMWSSGIGGKITSGVSGMVSRVSGEFGKLGSALSKKFPAIKSGLSSVSDMFMGVGGKIGTALQKVGGQVGAYAGIIGDSFAPILKKAAGFAPQFLKFMNIAGGIGIVVAGLGLLYNAFGGEIDNVLQMVQTKGPEVISNFCDGIVQRIPELMEQGAALIQNLLSAITANIPAIISGGTQIMAGLISGLAGQLPQLIPAALQMVLTLVTSLLSNVPQLINAGVQLIVGLVQGIINSVPQLLAAIPAVIQALVGGIVQCLPQLIVTGIQLLVSLIVGILQAIPQLLAVIPDIFRAFADGITSVDWIEVGRQILSAIKDGVLSIGASLWDTVKGIFSGGNEEAAAEGEKAGVKYAEGVSGTTSNVQTAAAGVANAATTSYCTALDLGSVQIGAASMNAGNTANTSLQMSDVPGAFGAAGQDAAMSLSSGITSNSSGVALSASNIGLAANTGVSASNMSGVYSNAGMAAGQSLSSSLSGQAGAVAAAADTVSNSASGVDISGTYADAGSQATKSMAGAMNSGTGTVVSAATAAANAAAQGLVISNFVGKAKTEGQKFYKSLANSIKAGIGTVRSAVNALMNAAKSAATGLGSAGQKLGAQFSAGIADGIRSGVSAARSAAAALMKSVESAVAGLGSEGQTLGTQFSAGIANGIRSGQSSISSAAAQVAQAAIRSAQANLQVHSPSRVGGWLGKMFDLGVEKGLRNNTGAVIQGMRFMTGALSSGTEKAIADMQKSSVLATTALGVSSYKSASGSRMHEGGADYTGILDEWERRQKRINRDRDVRPILLDGRQINRTKNKKGDIKL